MHNELAKQIAAQRKKARREFLENDRELCKLLRDAAQEAHAAGHIDEPTVAAIIAPKEDP